MLRVFAAALKLPEDFFGGVLARHFSILYCHHYPALTEAPLPGQLRTGAHTDFGAMTILAAKKRDAMTPVRLRRMICSCRDVNRTWSTHRQIPIYGLLR